MSEPLLPALPGLIAGWIVAGTAVAANPAALAVEYRQIEPVVAAEHETRIDFNQDGLDDFEIRQEQYGNRLSVRLVGFTHLLNDDPEAPILGHATFVGHYEAGKKVPTDPPIQFPPQDGEIVIFAEFASAEITDPDAPPTFSAAYDADGRLFLGVTVDLLDGSAAGWLEFRAGPGPGHLPVLVAMAWEKDPPDGVAIFPSLDHFSVTFESIDGDAAVISWPVQSSYGYEVEMSLELAEWYPVPFDALESEPGWARVRIKLAPTIEVAFFRVIAFPSD
jgi:hypothetical protein